MVSPVELVGTIITILLQIVKLARTATSYRGKCRLLRERVDLIVPFLEQLRESPWILDSATQRMLKQLRDATDRALALVESCQTWNFFKFYKKAFDRLQEQITHIMQCFHLANWTLLVNLDKDKHPFFMNVLDKLLLDGACRRLPPEVKEDLKSNISGLKNCDHMSPDATRRLDRIDRDLNCKAAARRSRATSDPSGSEHVGTSAAGATGGSRSASDDVGTSEEVRDIVRIANDILKKEKKVRQVKLKKEEKVRQVKLKKEDEVPLKKADEVRQVKPTKEDEFRQLARLAEEAIEVLQRLPVPASDTVSSLRDALREGRDIVRRYIEGGGSNGISTVLNRIEGYLRIIVVIACSHACKTMHKKGR